MSHETKDEEKILTLSKQEARTVIKGRPLEMSNSPDKIRLCMLS